MVYLGENLNRALSRTENGDKILILDGREGSNPSARRCVPEGTYLVLKTDGRAPGGVDYYGRPA